MTELDRFGDFCLAVTGQQHPPAALAEALIEARAARLLEATDPADAPAASAEAQRRADFVTLPEGVDGTRCSNCRFESEGHCTYHDKADLRGLAVSERTCCAFWDAPGTRRPWGLREAFDPSEPRDPQGRWAAVGAHLEKQHPFPPPFPHHLVPPGTGRPDLRARDPVLADWARREEEHGAAYHRAYTAHAVTRMLAQSAPKAVRLPPEGAPESRRLGRAKVAVEAAGEAAGEVRALSTVFAHHHAAVAASHPDAAEAIQAARAEAQRRYQAALSNAEAHIAALPDGPHKDKATRILDRQKLGADLRAVGP